MVNLVQRRLNRRDRARGIRAAGTSVTYAMLTGMQYVATGCSQLVLVSGADCNSRVVNPADERTFPLFGDAAGAVLLDDGAVRAGHACAPSGRVGPYAGVRSEPPPPGSCDPTPYSAGGRDALERFQAK